MQNFPGGKELRAVSYGMENNNSKLGDLITYVHTTGSVDRALDWGSKGC